MKVISIITLCLALSACAYNPNTYYPAGSSPADHMLRVGETLIRADQGAF